ncbi:hypothetical protein LJC07_08095 [Christensenellaceae bacterium OttesenSCG-928-L17]|nr:hypothetical protein [Christensenellaceae bacterium OttesenSCG-928-L17]
MSDEKKVENVVEEKNEQKASAKKAEAVAAPAPAPDGVEPIQMQTKKMPKMTIVGLCLFAAAMLALFFAPDSLNKGFSAMVNRAHPVVINTGILSTMSVSIVISVIMGRVLERLGFTDALMRLFLPIGKLLKFNAAVLIPAIYNILGDINAAGRIAGPILVKSKATLDEKKLAIFTMVQSEQSFSTFMIGLGCLTLAGARVFLVVILAIFAPLIICPLIGRFTLYRNCKAVELEDLPVFTPKTPFLNSVFAAGQEGMNTLFFLVLPAFAVVFGFIGLLENIGIWQYFETALTAMLTFLNIDPASGMLSILASPTLAMTALTETAASLDPRWVVGSFVLGASGFPLSVIVGQIPLIWSSCAEMKPGEALRPALIGIVFRILTAGLFASLLGGLLIA